MHSCASSGVRKLEEAAGVAWRAELVAGAFARWREWDCLVGAKADVAGVEATSAMRMAMLLWEAFMVYLVFVLLLSGRFWIVRNIRKILRLAFGS